MKNDMQTNFHSLNRKYIMKTISYKRKILTFVSALAGIIGLLTAQIALAACAPIGQGGVLTYLGGNITIEEKVASAGFTSQLGLYTAAGGRVDLSSATPPANTPFIMYNWNRNQTILNELFPYVVTFDPSTFSIPLGPINLGIFVQNTGHTYFMGLGGANPDGIAHALVVNNLNGTFDVGFEDLLNGGDCDFDDNIFIFQGGITDDELVKLLTSGPDEDNDGKIDLVVTVGAPAAVVYDFTIFYNDSQPVVIIDTVPAEWVDIMTNPSAGSVNVFNSGKGPNSKSSTKIEWSIAQPGSLNVIAKTRPSPGNNPKFSPTSCGLLSLNDGAKAFEANPDTGELVLDGQGQPILVFGPTNPIKLIAVGDEDIGALPANYPRDGSGDFDSDGLTDAQEVFDLGTNPCLVDTDGDGANDPIDSAPLDPNVQ